MRPSWPDPSDVASPDRVGYVEGCRDHAAEAADGFDPR
jgi:hypothetical protein